MTSPFELPTFNGWTIDQRLRQFRKVVRGENPQIEFVEASDLSETTRGTGGFGSSGT